MLNSNMQKIWHAAMQLTNNTVSANEPNYFVVHERILRENFAKMINDARIQSPNNAELFDNAFIEDFINKALGYILSSST